MAEGKTGALFGWCGRAAAGLSARADLVEPFGKFGRHLGVAFQLADDLKDLVGADKGKPRFADLKNRNPSMPILWSADRSAEARELLEAAWSSQTLDDEEVLGLGELLLKNGAQQAVMQDLEREVEAAVACLEVLGRPDWLAEIEELAASFVAGCDPEAA
jgi:octaprenyl-diphosphate synthase